MSLADELLHDLEDGGDDQMETIAEEDEDVMDIEDVAPVIETDKSIRESARLRDSEQLNTIMKKIKEYQEKPRSNTEVAGPVEADPEYQLIVEANDISVEIDNDINIIHKYVRDLYSQRFPELESLVPGALEYIGTVKELGNDLESAKSNERLQQILTPATIMVVSVTVSTTQGRLLDEEELSRTMEAVDMAVELTESKLTILSYVESRMTFIAPNITAIIGSSSAAKIMGVAGGLTKLSKMPSCNVLLLGAQKKTLSGFASTAVLPHTGFIYYSPVVQQLPPDLRMKGARLVAGKLSLASRVDSFHESSEGAVGEKLRGDIDEKIEKWIEPPPVKQVKALPRPVDKPAKKRGGRRARKQKERLGMTDLRRQANRMNFGEIEEDAYQADLGMSLGRLGKSNSGRVRGPAVDSKTKARISKTLQQKLQKQQTQTWGGSTTVKRTVSGTASSVAFTPLQGLEIVNPQAAEQKGRQTSNKYFSASAGFKKLNEKT